MANGLGSILGRAIQGGQQFQQAGLREVGLQQAEQTQALRRAALGLPTTAPAQPFSMAPVSPGAQLVQPEIPQEQALAQMAISDPAAFEQTNKALGLDTQTKKNEFADFAFKLKSAPFENRAQLIQERIASVEARGGDASQTKQLIQMPQEQQDTALQVAQIAALSPKERADLASGKGMSAEQRSFEAQIANLSEEDKQKAREIKLGLKPRAVGSAVQTVTAEGIAEDIAETEATIAQRKKFAEMTGSSRAKAIDSGFERIVKIDTGLNTIDRAIKALKGGAKTGAIQKFLPSIRAASVELKNIRNQLALDVIGSVTLGAISEAELELAKETALPEGLDEEELIAHLEDRNDAQLKLRGYFQEQIDHLDQGGTVASFLRMKRREAGEGGAQETVEATVVEQQPAQQPAPPPGFVIEGAQ